jgi:FkbM family methyltransferase
MNIRKHNLGNYIVPADTENGVCLEIGANVGSFTKKYSNHFRLIHFYEPLLECFNITSEKIKDNPNIQGFNLAGYSSSDINKEMMLHRNKDSGSSALKTSAINSDWVDTIHSIKTISLPDMIKNLNVSQIDYCKSDCETAEYHIFLNQDLSKIKYIGLELHNQMGSDKWYELLDYIGNTHKLVSGNTTWKLGRNSELLFSRL